jgi:single-strand DNA-binding protein
MSVNKVILIGNLGKDPELTNLPSGGQVAKFSLATTEKFKDKSGVYQDKTDWHNIVIWGKTAENAAKYLKKGSPVYLEGRISYGSYQDKDGVKKYTTDIVVSSMQFLGSKQGGNDNNQGSEQQPNDSQNDNSNTQDDLPF